MRLQLISSTFGPSIKYEHNKWLNLYLSKFIQNKSKTFQVPNNYHQFFFGEFSIIRPKNIILAPKNVFLFGDSTDFNMRHRVMKVSSSRNYLYYWYSLLYIQDEGESITFWAQNSCRIECISSKIHSKVNWYVFSSWWCVVLKLKYYFRV